MSDTNEITSIWDGWERQIKYEMQDESGGYCALGWLWHQLPKGAKVNGPRVGKWIQANLNPPATYLHPKGFEMFPRSVEAHAVAWANNEGLLTPDQFRQIDINLQIEAVSKPLIDSVEIAVGVSA